MFFDNHCTAGLDLSKQFFVELSVSGSRPLRALEEKQKLDSHHLRTQCSRTERDIFERALEKAGSISGQILNLAKDRSHIRDTAFAECLEIYKESEKYYLTTLN